MQHNDTWQEPGGVVATLARPWPAVTPAPDTAASWRRAIVGISAVMSALRTLKGDVLLHYTTIWPSHWVIRIIAITIQIHIFTIFLLITLGFLTSTKAGSIRVRGGCWVLSPVGGTCWENKNILDSNFRPGDVCSAQSVAVQCMHFKLDRHVLRYFYAPLKVFKSV